MTYIHAGVRFSPCCNKYRYALWRVWDTALPLVAFIGLNPSTADDRTDDPTIRRCVGFAKSWGYGGLRMFNLFAFRATDPAEMKAAADPFGPENVHALCDGTRGILTVAAWGNHGSFKGADKSARVLIHGMHILKLTKQGQPAHPLYLRKDLRPILWDALEQKP